MQNSHVVLRLKVLAAYQHFYSFDAIYMWIVKWRNIDVTPRAILINPSRYV